MADIKEDIGAPNSEAQFIEEDTKKQNSKPKRVSSLDIFRGLTVAVNPL